MEAVTIRCVGRHLAGQGTVRPIVWKSVSGVQPWLHAPHFLGSPGAELGRRTASSCGSAGRATGDMVGEGQTGTSKGAGDRGLWGGAVHSPEGFSQKHHGLGDSGPPRGRRGCGAGRPADPTPPGCARQHRASEWGAWSPRQAHRVRDLGWAPATCAPQARQRLPVAAAGCEQQPVLPLPLCLWSPELLVCFAW